MELFLNLLWFAIALIGLALWRSIQPAESRPSRSAAWRQWTAFLCAAVLMFFVVSLSDDLRAEYPVFDESSTCRRQSADMAAQHGAPGHPSHGPGSVFAVLPVMHLAVDSATAALDVAPAPAHASKRFCRFSAGRSPPALASI